MKRQDATMTFAGMTEPSAPREKSKAEARAEDPWDAVASECPCRVSAEEHCKRARVHVETPIIDAEARMVAMSPVMCLPADTKLGEFWRKTSAFLRATL